MAISGSNTSGSDTSGMYSIIGQGVDDLQAMHESMQSGVFDIIAAIQKRKEREQAQQQFEQSLAEQKREFNMTAGQRRRSQNMQGIDMLGQARINANVLSRQRSFKGDLSAALRRA
jgi:hypothetical protein